MLLNNAFLIFFWFFFQEFSFPLSPIYRCIAMDSISPWYLWFTINVSPEYLWFIIKTSLKFRIKIRFEERLWGFPSFNSLWIYFPLQLWKKSWLRISLRDLLTQQKHHQTKNPYRSTQPGLNYIQNRISSFWRNPKKKEKIIFSSMPGPLLAPSLTQKPIAEQLLFFWQINIGFSNRILEQASYRSSPPLSCEGLRASRPAGKQQHTAH